MFTNEKGNTLITVLLVSLIFTVIGMAIVASSIGGAKKTETRESEVSITYHSIKVVDDMTAELAQRLDSIPLKNNSLGVLDEFTVQGDFDYKVRELLDSIIISHRDNPEIACLNIVDISSPSISFINNDNDCGVNLTDYTHFNINKDKDYTRAFDIELITKNPIETEGKVTRTITKRIILSPLPSFLKYAAGSDGELILNGSPNFRGNVYANLLRINKEAEYNLRNGTSEKWATPMSSINGDLYSRSAELLSILQKDNFYYGNVPKLKHDSQFGNIEFTKTMDESVNKVLANADLSLKMNEGNFASNLKSHIDAEVGSPSGFFDNCTIIEEGEEKAPVDYNESCIKSDEPYNGPSSLGIGGNLSVTSTAYSIDLDTLSVNGELVLTSNAGLTVNDNINVSGNLVIHNNNGIKINGKIHVAGDLYIVNNSDLELLGNIYVAGNTHLLNYGGSFLVRNSLISAGTISAEAHSGSGLKFGNSNESSKGIVSGENIIIKPLNSKIEINRNIFSNQSFEISGDDEFGSIENDEVIFDSVVYAGENAYISNTNIVGAENNTKQLILLARNELLMTRINEFNNFDSIKEDGIPYLPLNDSKIKPLKGFFYTDNKATLYGVGSLFYIEGGVFAKKSLTINAVRGQVNDIVNIPSSSFQEGSYSRFIVDYDQNVLLNKIDVLPLVDQLQIFSDELIVK